MNKSHSCLLAAFCVMLAGCSGAQRREAKDASQAVYAAEASVKSAKQNGSSSCAATEMRLADSNLQLAKSNLEKKQYGLALTLGKSADSNAAAAVKRCEELKAKAKAKAKKK